MLRNVCGMLVSIISYRIAAVNSRFLSDATLDGVVIPLMVTVQCLCSLWPCPQSRC